MCSQHTDAICDLGTRMCPTMDRLAAELDAAMARQGEVVPLVAEDGDAFDAYAFACALLDCR